MARGDTLMGWHRRLGHARAKPIKELARNKSADGLMLTDHSVKKCEACKLVKMTRTAVPQHSAGGTPADQVCHTDLCCPFKRSLHGYRYFMLVSWKSFVWCYLLKRKQNEALDNIEIFLAMLDRQYGTVAAELKIVRSDGGGEFS